MLLKIFSPFLFLLCAQLIFYFIYSGFSYSPNVNTQFIIFGLYASTFLSIIIFCSYTKVLIKENIEFCTNKKIDIFALFLTLFFIVKPTVIMYLMGVEFGFDYVRQNFYSSDIIRSSAFGSMSIAIFVQTYVASFLWFYVIYLIGSKNKSSTYLFYFILFSLVLYNMSYAGRFYMYFAIILLYLKTIIEGRNPLVFLKKYGLILFSFLLASTLIVSVRNNKDGLANSSRDMISLLEYHVLQPFFLSQKIEYKQIVVEGYPFRSFVEGLFGPILHLGGVSFKDQAYGKYSRIFDEPTLYSFNTGSWYNAFSTFFPYIYMDFGMLSFIMIFIIIGYLFLTSYLIVDVVLRVKFLAYISLMLYFSLFQAPIFSNGTMFIVLLFPWFYFFYKKIKFRMS